jgi:hypoxanthine phosphoribosyltransferase
VDDIASSGDTLELARRLLKKVGAKTIKTASLVCKEEGYRPDWAAWESEELFVFPWDYEPVAEDDRF